MTENKLNSKPIFSSPSLFLFLSSSYTDTQKACYKCVYYYNHCVLYYFNPVCVRLTHRLNYVYSEPNLRKIKNVFFDNPENCSYPTKNKNALI